MAIGSILLPTPLVALWAYYFFIKSTNYWRRKIFCIFEILKKATIIFSLIIITVLSTGSYFIHYFFLKSYKADFKSYILTNKENLQSSELIINSNELYINTQIIEWEDDNEELLYKGILYDVISIKTNDEKTVLTVFADVEEEEIKNKFASNYDEDSDKSLKLLKQFLALQYISPTNELFNTCSISTILVNHKDYRFHISSGFLSQETPPPNLSI